MRTTSQPLCEAHASESVDLFRPVRVFPLDKSPLVPWLDARPRRNSFYQLFLFVGGDGRSQLDQRSFSIRAPMLIFVAPGQLNSWSAMKNARGFGIFFSPEFFYASGPKSDFLFQMPLFYPQAGEPVIYLERGNKNRFLTFFTTIFREAHSTTLHKDDIVRAYLTLILSKAAEIATIPPARESKLGQRVHHILREHCPPLVTVTELAKRLGVSRSHLTNTVQLESGLTPSALIHERRLLEAKRLLRQSNGTVSEIAYHLRFRDPSYFARFFRAATGTSPRLYRQEAFGKTSVVKVKPD